MDILKFLKSGNTRIKSGLF